VNEAIRNAIVLGALALLTSGVLASKRRATWALGLALVSTLSAAVLGVLTLSGVDITLAAAPLDAVGRLFLWWVLAALLVAVGGVRGVGSPINGAFIGGMAFGGLGSGVALAIQHGEAKSKARIMLAACAGAIAGPLGTEASVLLGAQPVFWRSFSLALVLAIIGAWPAGMASKVERVGDPLLLVLSAPILAVAWFNPTAGLGLALVSLGVLAAVKRNFNERQRTTSARPERTGWYTWWLCTVLVLLLLTPAGVLGYAVESLPYLERTAGRFLPEIVGGASFLWSTFGGALPVALTAEQFTRLDPHGLDAETWRAVVAAAAVGSGGLGLRICGRQTLKAGWHRWVLQVAVVALAITTGWFR
jgi:hypothetical protein